MRINACWTTIIDPNDPRLQLSCILCVYYSCISHYCCWNMYNTVYPHMIHDHGYNVIESNLVNSCKFIRALFVSDQNQFQSLPIRCDSYEYKNGQTMLTWPFAFSSTSITCTEYVRFQLYLICMRNLLGNYLATEWFKTRFRQIHHHPPWEMNNNRHSRHIIFGSIYSRCFNRTENIWCQVCPYRFTSWSCPECEHG